MLVFQRSDSVKILFESSRENKGGGVKAGVVVSSRSREGNMPRITLVSQ